MTRSLARPLLALALLLPTALLAGCAADQPPTLGGEKLVEAQKLRLDSLAAERAEPPAKKAVRRR